jgi:CRISPR-associated endonuclease/helicase Cas3
MMVTFVSQCEKNALKKTRRVLDAFADRIGDNTWQTLITEDGLLAVKKMLRQTASKSTAVSCHWIRSRSRSQFLWVVGKRERFDGAGRVPVNYTEKHIKSTEFENDWQFLPLIKSLAAVAALLHDWGKASKLFQEKLKPGAKFRGDPIRHEWISCLILNALITSVGKDSDKPWLNILSTGSFDEASLACAVKGNPDKPLTGLPSAAQLIAWLILTHHRLPKLARDDDFLNMLQGEKAETIESILRRMSKEWGYENRRDEEEYQARVQECFQFPKGLLSNSSRWVKELKRWAGKLQDQLPLVENLMENGAYRLVLHHARLCLMLGDHKYSSSDADKGWQNETGLFANTDRASKQLKQKLDEHLVGVTSWATKTAHMLPNFENAPPLVEDALVLLTKSKEKKYQWQDKAVAKIQVYRNDTDNKVSGYFIVNMASTGCGKTIANAKVMQALSADTKSLRYILALGLRTLTLQTGDEYRERIGLSNDELAVLIGSRAVTELHSKSIQEQKQISHSDSGSESAESLLEEDLDYSGILPEEGLSTVLTTDRDKQFLYAPVLACTIDHIMAATETIRGGRYILPSLRLMSSDLVIDEVDDFTGSDLIAIARLVHLAGMLGRKVMISSATIPPDLAEGFFNAYRLGWKLHCASRDASPEIGCVWIDEYKTNISSVPVSSAKNPNALYRASHDKYIAKRVEKLKTADAKRKAFIALCHLDGDSLNKESEETKQDRYFSIVFNNIIKLHESHNTIDHHSGKHISFGVVRIANITPCVVLTKYLCGVELPENVDIKVLPYHSQQVLLLRHEQEKHLDQVLKRKEQSGDEPQAFSNVIIRDHIQHSNSKHLIFILVATPVEEVGRDHDFDWAVVEPSSYRSIIQLAGRVKRHRIGEVGVPNIAILQYNWKAFKAGDESGGKYFQRPGYEVKATLDTHDLTQLVDTRKLAKSLDAIPRIDYVKNEIGGYRESLSLLEHAVTQSDLVNYGRSGYEYLQGYLSECWYLTALSQGEHEFRKSEKTTKIYYVINGDDDCYFCEKDEDGHPFPVEKILNIRIKEHDSRYERRLWLRREYESSIETLETLSEMTNFWKSLRYGELSFVHRDGCEYEYNDQFGLVVSEK